MSRSQAVLLALVMIAGLSTGGTDTPPVFADYAAMRAHLGTLFGEQRYDEAAALLEAHIDAFPDHLESNAFNLAIMYVMVGRHSDAIRVLTRAADDGIWFGKYNIQSALLEPLFTEPAFETFLARNDAMRRAATPGCVLVDIALPVDYDPERRYPLFLALHGGDGSNDEFRAAWHSPRLAREFVLAYVQSSVPSNMRGFSWYEPEDIRRDVMTAYGRIASQYAIDPERIYVGGYSAGAIATFCMAFDSPLAVRGYLCLGPPIPREILTPENIKRAVDRGLRGAFIVGAHDPFLPEATAMAATFDSLGHAVETLVLPKADHRYPEDLPARIDDALARILE